MSTLVDYKYPVINAKGGFEVASPFNQLVPKQIVFECVSVASIKTLEERWNVKQNVYLNNSLPESEYKYAVQQNIPMVELRNSANTRIFIPANYILSYPNSDGHIYKSIGMEVIFPIMPESADLATLKETIVQEALGLYGVDVTVNVIDGQALYLIPHTDHQNMVTGRALMRTKTMSDKQTIVHLTKTVNDQAFRIQMLEQFIKERHT